METTRPDDSTRRLFWTATPLLVGISVGLITYIGFVNNVALPINPYTLGLECGVELGYRLVDTIFEVSEDLKSTKDFDIRREPQTITKQVIRTFGVGLATAINEDQVSKIIDEVFTAGLTTILITGADLIQ
jgi:hypothetical protein